MARLDLMLQDFRLTTAEIFYHLPDYPKLLQLYLWQDYDKMPDFPVLMRFLNFWENELDGKLHSVKIASCKIITPGELVFIDKEFRID